MSTLTKSLSIALLFVLNACAAGNATSFARVQAGGFGGGGGGGGAMSAANVDPAAHAPVERAYEPPMVDHPHSGMIEDRGFHVEHDGCSRCR